MNTNQKWQFISDDGHGWLGIPEDSYKFLKITATRYSYYCSKKKIVYLEEDCDAGKAINAMEKLGLTPEITEIRVNGQSSVRNLPRMA